MIAVISKGSASSRPDEATSVEPQHEQIELSVVVPCFNERKAVEQTVRKLLSDLSVIPVEVIIVDDGSVDGTSQILDALAAKLNSLRVVRHAQNKGYGGALKTGIRNAKGRFVAITDADGTYPTDRIVDLFERAKAGADMVVGARVSAGVVYSKLRAIPKIFMRRYCVWLTGQPIPDMNSGLRVFRRETLERFLPYLPNTFSFTTTVTIAFLTNQLVVEYIPITYAARVGNSKISPIRDTVRFIQLIIRTALYFAPLRVFGPLIFLLWTGFLFSASYDTFVSKDLSDKTLILLTFCTNVTILALLADMIDKRLQS